MLSAPRILFASVCFFVPLLTAQEPAPTAAQLQRITGSITAVDAATHIVTVKEDKTGTDYSVELQNTKSLRKVDPASLDLKKATRITADDLLVGDRVQVFAAKAEDNPNALAARGVILISARELQSVHQEQAAAWQHATRGVVTQVDGEGKFSLSQRTPQATKVLLVDAQKAEFTRYSQSDPKVPAASKLTDLQVGDQVRVIGETSADGLTLTAQRVYSSPMRMLVCTVSGIAADGKSITVKNLQDKQTVTVALNDDSAVRKLPPMMAMALARRLNPAAAGAGPVGGSGANGTAGSGGANPQAGARPGEASPETPGGGNWRGNAGGSPGATQGTAGSGDGASGGTGGGAMRPGAGMRSGDMSQMLDRIPKISSTELKPGDAVMVAGVPINNDKSHLLATNVIAGVEPIFQSASPRQMQSLGDWGLNAGAGGGDGMPQ